MTRIDHPATCVEAEPFALQVTDESMEPEFARGCVVIVDPTGHARDGAFVVAETADGLVFRLLRASDGGWRLEPTNPAFAPAPLPDGLAAVRGVVVQRAGRRRGYHKRYD